MTDDGDGLKDRRSVLKAITAGAVSATAFAGAASGETAPRSSETAEAFARFGDRETIDGLFEAHARPVVSELVDRGYLPEETNPVESVVALHEYGDADEGGLATVSTGARDGTDVVDVRVRQVTEDAEIEYHINPGMEDSYAMVTPDEGEEGTAIFADGSEGSFSTTSSCCDCTDGNCGETRCTDDYCRCDGNYIYYYEEQYCCARINGSCVCTWSRDGCGVQCQEYSPYYCQ